MESEEKKVTEETVPETVPEASREEPVNPELLEYVKRRQALARAKADWTELLAQLKKSPDRKLRKAARRREQYEEAKKMSLAIPTFLAMIMLFMRIYLGIVICAAAGAGIYFWVKKRHEADEKLLSEQEPRYTGCRDALLKARAEELELRETAEKLIEELEKKEKQQRR